ncbi:Fumarylacetoacetate (FAA) hydrolase family protein [Pelagimonas phthalicica]|uniref:Fumarylacetoacetate (FAA) hydrolase family protein n=1 Tax=Pelagimonas phthalicica TaxID=1037362 RepID=A0A238JHG5_9RHOB|nr:fumarylacetoacetate hydrolase family protein [Pelagimonas phthalicica]TDS89727.1 fumarylacetoacetate (FAA) hydrolase [Pelagimonas phthalicica]SMX29895.1 Fumarylacetoacetate (FAA) hydrolase family protein [Pelagimonas phthalicica]
MRFATLPNGTPDGRLHVVSRDNARCMPSEVAMTLQAALENWDALKPDLEKEYARLNQGGGQAFDMSQALAPLPRAWQWLDGSAFDSHGALMDAAYKVKAEKIPGKPLMYQGVSDRFYSGSEDIPFPTEDDGIDVEGEFGLITTAVPMGTTDTLPHIALLVQINDWSLRKLGPPEMKTGFGWVQTKPACSVAPIALTPDELGEAWRDARVDLPLTVEIKGEKLGAPQGYDMGFGFDQLVAHAAYSRALPAGTVVGSGTVSNENCREVGSACIAERRAIEMIDTGAPEMPFLEFGDHIRMECRAKDGSPLFGEIAQTVTKA